MSLMAREGLAERIAHSDILSYEWIEITTIAAELFEMFPTYHIREMFTELAAIQNIDDPEERLDHKYDHILELITDRMVQKRYRKLKHLADRRHKLFHADQLVVFPYRRVGKELTEEELEHIEEKIDSYLEAGFYRETVYCFSNNYHW